ncbi:MAG TPA: BA14K family protein [Rhizobium sp.]|nr:BA14K family protein [Rhizobium sp.]
MTMSIKRLAALVLASAVVLTSYAPSQAMPVPVPVPAMKTATDVVTVDYYRRPPYYDYNGYRGYREPRPGYRYYNGYWFPLAAFAAGAIIGGAMLAPSVPRAGNINPKHYDWCAARYRSYDPYSNTFQPYNGPRRQCYSPYY